ncbi:MAG: NADPH:quinone oxidoreductase family protein [Armatimonadetes bacterium]|nr:NADPH:quinone oxidoreductase family protein [Anaerolineae bacterium]
MQVVRAHHFGTPDVLVYESLPDPQPGPGQLRIKVESASVNYADVMRRSNTPYPFPTTLPFIPGSEVAGVVDALGEGVSVPPIGTRVFAVIGDGSTGYAQYAIATAGQAIPIPPGLSADQACVLIVAGVTPLLIFQELARLQPGESVLIPAASGGVGSYAVQIAKLLGAGTVIGAASSPAKRQTVLGLGADHVVDYTQPDWHQRVLDLTDGRGVDVVLEMTGGSIFAQSVKCLAPFGRLVVYGMASREPLQFDQDTILKLFYSPSLNQSLHVFSLGLWFGLRFPAALSAMQTLIGYAASGQLQVNVNHVLPLSQAADAHRLMEARQTTGKIVLKPWQDA